MNSSTGSMRTSSGNDAVSATAVAPSKEAGLCACWLPGIHGSEEAEEGPRYGEFEVPHDESEEEEEDEVVGREPSSHESETATSSDSQEGESEEGEGDQGEGGRKWGGKGGACAGKKWEEEELRCLSSCVFNHACCRWRAKEASMQLKCGCQCVSVGVGEGVRERVECVCVCVFVYLNEQCDSIHLLQGS